MQSRFLVFVFLSCSLICQTGYSIPKTQKETKKVPPVELGTQSSLARTKLNSQFGFNFLSGSAVISGFQLGRLVSSTHLVYLGPELNFMLFSPGSILNVLLGGWVENHWFDDFKKTIDLGLSMGAGFANQKPDWKTTNMVVLFEASYSQVMNESLSLRMQVRPGWVAGRVLAILNFNAQFRFL